MELGPGRYAVRLDGLYVDRHGNKTLVFKGVSHRRITISLPVGSTLSEETKAARQLALNYLTQKFREEDVKVFVSQMEERYGPKFWIRCVTDQNVDRASLVDLFNVWFEEVGVGT